MGKIIIPYKPREQQKRMHSGMESKRFSVIVAHRRWGKALDVDTIIPVAEGGFKRMGELVVGDRVFDEDGKVCNVLASHNILKNRKCYRVCFNDGNEIICDEDHLWATQTKLDRTHRVGRNKTGSRLERLGVLKERPFTAKSTKEIKDTILYCGEANHSIRLCNPVNFDKKELLIPPYILGLWLGDGTSRSNQFTSMDEFVVSAFKEYAAMYGGVVEPVKHQNSGRAITYKVTNGFADKLRALDLIKNKHIPECYLYSDVYDRTELFKGLMDTDGCINKNSSSCEFTQKENKIIENFGVLLASLGIKYSKTTKIINNKKYIRFKFRPTFCPFKIKRKCDRYKKVPRRDSITRYIIDVSEVKTRPVKCITVDSKNGLYLCGEGFIPTHNTVCVVNHLIKQAILCTKQDPRYGYVAPYRNQGKQLAWLYLKRFTQVIPGVKINESELDVTLPNKAVIRIYGADNPDALRGMYFDGVVLDEVAQMKPEVWDEIVLPALADRKGWAVFIGTPKGINSFYNIYTTAVGNPDLYYSDVFTVTETDALDPEEVELQRSIQSENKFRQEYLCDFTASVEDALIPIDLVENAYGRIIPAHAYKMQPIIFGVDVARFGDDKSVIYVRQGLATLEIKKYSGVDLFQFSETVMHKIREYDPDAVFVDVVGVGAGVVDMLRNKQFGDVVTGINSGNRPVNSVAYVNKRAEVWARMKEWLELGGCIPKDNELRVDLVSPLYSYDSANRMKLEKKEDMKARGVKSPDVADALALTFAQPVAKRKPEFLAMAAQRKEYKPFDKLAQLGV